MYFVTQLGVRHMAELIELQPPPFAPGKLAASGVPAQGFCAPRDMRSAHAR